MIRKNFSNHLILVRSFSQKSTNQPTDKATAISAELLELNFKIKLEETGKTRRNEENQEQTEKWKKKHQKT